MRPLRMYPTCGVFFNPVEILGIPRDLRSMGLRKAILVFCDKRTECQKGLFPAEKMYHVCRELVLLIKEEFPQSTDPLRLMRFPMPLLRCEREELSC
jgi:hypothetical protein